MKSVITSLFLVAVSGLFALSASAPTQWTQPVPVNEVNTDSAEEWSPFLSFDGRTLYFARVRSDTFYYGRIFEATRQQPFGPFTSVSEVLKSNGQHVLTPWVSPDNLRMYYFAQTESPILWQLKVSERVSVNDPWPQGSDISELNQLGRLNMPRLTADELNIVFSSYNIAGGHGSYDLWMATRPDRFSPFGQVRNLSEINTASSDHTPFLSPDGLTLTFSSNRIDGHTYQLYRATRQSLIEPFGNIEHLSLFDTPGGFSVHPSISSDGKTFYFMRQLGDDITTRDIWVSYLIEGELYYVDANAPTGGNGSTWATAFNNLQDALAVAQYGDEIRVAQGIYKPGPRTPPPPPPPPPPGSLSNDPNAAVDGGNRTFTFQLKNGVVIKGGYEGFGELNPDARDINKYKTILSGDIGIPGDNSDNCYHVVVSDTTNVTAVLDGFTITAGYANGDYPSPHAFGGGILNLGGSPTIIYCTFSQNAAGRDGGGIFNGDYSSPTLTNCTFTANSALFDGGAICNRDSSPTLVNCTFTGNSANHGGAISNWPASTAVSNCTFTANSAEIGGAVFNWDSGLALSSCLFSSNSAREWGGAICNLIDSSTMLTNCTFVANSAPNGNAVACLSFEPPAPSNLQATNCIFWDGGNEIWKNDDSQITITYSDVQHGWPGQGNINADPCFVQPGILGLVSHWTFDEAHGTTAYDSAGNNHGTVYGAAWTIGQVDGALDFDGVDDYVDIPYDSRLDIDTSEGITLAVWIKLDSYPDSTHQGPIFGLFDSAGAGTKNYLAIAKSIYGNVIAWDQWPPSSGGITSIKPYLDTWYHVLVVEDSSHRAIYINGSLDSSDNMYESYQGNTPDTIRIASRADAWAPFYFDGTIDEVIIFDRALSAEEISKVYESRIYGDYHLLPDSPCIDAGDNDSLPQDLTDLDGKPRIIGGRVDMGAYEFNNCPTADAGPDQLIECLCDSGRGTKVTLDGSASTDSDSTPGTNDDIASFNWYQLDPFDPNSKDLLGSGRIFDCYLPLGEHFIALEVTDRTGASDTNDVTIIIQDTISPIFTTIPQDTTVECDGSGNLDELNVWLTSAVAQDQCCNLTITNDFVGLSAGCGETGSATVTWMAEDASGNKATTPPATFTIIDTTPPAVTCPPDVTLECPSDTTPSATGQATATDTCGSVTISYTDTSEPGCGNTQTITRTWIATDECDNTSTCAQTITVVDTTPPVITCPNTIAVSGGLGDTKVSFDISATDDCDPNPVVTTNIPSGSFFQTGITTVTATATDACGNASTCTFDVLVSCFAVNHLKLETKDLRCRGIALLEVTSDQGIFVYEPQPGKERLRTNTIVDDGVNGPVLINTSCSRPLDIGDVFGPYTVTNLVKIFRGDRDNNARTLDIKGAFNPAIPLDLTVDDVTFIIGNQGNTLTFSIPAGSFIPQAEPELQMFKFDSPPGSHPDIKAMFDLLKCTFDLKIKGPLDTGDITIPNLTVTMLAGPNLGQEVLVVQTKPNYLEYKNKHKLSCCPK